MMEPDKVLGDAPTITDGRIGMRESDLESRLNSMQAALKKPVLDQEGKPLGDYRALRQEFVVANHLRLK